MDYRFLKSRRYAFFWLLILMTVSIMGCGNRETAEKIKLSFEPYEKVKYTPFVVEPVNTDPVVNLDIVCDNYEYVQYYPAGEGSVISKVMVEPGSIVKAGDTLAGYRTLELEDKLKEYEESIAKNTLLREHYVKLNEIEHSDDLDAVIARLDRSLEIDNLYVRETRAKIKDNIIVAERDGMVSQVSLDIENKELSKKQLLFTVLYSDGIYTAETDEDIPISEGTASNGIGGFTNFRFNFLKREVLPDGNYRYYFKFVPGESGFCNINKLTLAVLQPSLDNVLCIPQNYVFEVDGKSYVYVLDDNDNLRAREISVRGGIDRMAIVNSGLSAGERVVKR